MGGYHNAHYHQWDWQYRDGLPVVRAENSIVEIVENLSMRIRLFDDNAHICFQSDNLAAEMTISFGLAIAKDAMPVSFFLPGRSHEA